MREIKMRPSISQEADAIEGTSAEGAELPA